MQGQGGRAFTALLRSLDFSLRVQEPRKGVKQRSDTIRCAGFLCSTIVLCHPNTLAGFQQQCLTRGRVPVLEWMNTTRVSPIVLRLKSILHGGLAHSLLPTWLVSLPTVPGSLLPSRWPSLAAALLPWLGLFPPRGPCFPTPILHHTPFSSLLAPLHQEDLGCGITHMERLS